MLRENVGDGFLATSAAPPTTISSGGQTDENQSELSMNIENYEFSSRIRSSDIKDDDEDFSDSYVTLLDSKAKQKVSSSKFFWCNSMRLQCRIFLYFAALVSVTFLLYATLSRDSTNFSVHDEKSGRRSKSDYGSKEFHSKLDKTPPPARVKLEIYMESQCPDTTKFIDSQLMPVYDELRAYLDLKIIPFGKAKWTRLETTSQEDYSFQCQHGPRECLVNQVMCCGIERLKTVEKYLPYVACVQATPPNGHEQVKCDEKFSLDHKDMQECANGREGRLLHHRMGELTKALKPSAVFIPWILVDGTREKRALSELKQLICERLNKNFGVKPEPCAKLTLLLPASTAAINMRRRRGDS